MNGDMRRQVVEALHARLTPEFVEARVQELLRQGEDVGGGINAFRLVRFHTWPTNFRV